jgi:hypothetical protein
MNIEHFIGESGVRHAKQKSAAHNAVTIAGGA